MRKVFIIKLCCDHVGYDIEVYFSEIEAINRFNSINRDNTSCDTVVLESHKEDKTIVVFAMNRLTPE
jgi:hypothetical protein